jgi:hypothetical protein
MREQEEGLSSNSDEDQPTLLAPGKNFLINAELINYFSGLLRVT